MPTIAPGALVSAKAFVNAASIAARFAAGNDSLSAPCAAPCVAQATSAAATSIVAREWTRRLTPSKFIAILLALLIQNVARELNDTGALANASAPSRERR